jgi:hypothetical protein
MMVEAHSAKQYWPKEECVHAHADHSGIAKMTKRQGSIFQSVKGAIRRAMTPTADIARESQLHEEGHVVVRRTIMFQVMLALTLLSTDTTCTARAILSSNTACGPI